MFKNIIFLNPELPRTHDLDLGCENTGVSSNPKKSKEQNKHNALSVLLILCLARDRNQQMPLAVCSFCLRAGSPNRRMPLAFLNILNNYMVDENSKSMNSLSGVHFLLTSRKYEPEAKIRNALSVLMILWLIELEISRCP